MRRYLDDDVTTRVRRHGRPRGLSERIQSPAGMLAIEELTSRISSADISSVLKRLEAGFDPDLDTSARRRAIGLDRSDALKNKREPHALAERDFERLKADASPVDVVLATSMLQVGVDVSRFGLMVVTGQPKNTAEYIQASSRVGRSAEKPGLVVTLYNWSRPRDLAHYEDFEYYHATYYRQVEALSVTPYTRRALDRGTAATFVAAVRNATEPYSHEADAQDVDLDGPLVRSVTDPAAEPGRSRVRPARPGLPRRAHRGAAGRMGDGQDRLHPARVLQADRQAAAQRPARGGRRRRVDDADRPDVDAGDGERDQPAAPGREPVRSRVRPARLVVRRPG